MSAKLIAASAALLVLCGCVGAGSEPTGKMLDSADLGLGDTAATVQPSWWTALGDPQFDALVTRALADNPRLEEAMARVRAAQAAADAARGDSLPKVTIDGEEQWQRFSERFIYPPPYGGGHYWLGSVQGNLSWDLDFWGRQKALIGEARAGAEAARLDVEAARLAITAALAEAYVSLDRAYALLDVADRTVDQRTRLVDLVGRRVKAGLDSRVEQRQAEGLLAEGRVARLQAIAERDMAVHAIAALTGQGAAAYDTIKRPTLDAGAVLPLPDALPADLLARRPDVLAARARVEARLSGRKAAVAAFYPNVNLLGFAGFQAIGLSHLLSSGAGIYGAGPAIHLPLFDARLKPNLRAATADVDAAVAGYNGVVLGAVQQVADRLSAIQSLEHQIKEQTRARDAAEEAYGLSDRRYSKGLSNYVAVLSVEEQLLGARRQLAVLKAQYAIERIKLLLAVGGGFQPEPQPTTTVAAPAGPALKE
ncbi:MAG: efflux transporter outer membrane subunit [Alphaproteobacteria bacterium]|nr:efflux transporter outer membrane subunit [Alphaproteobacteria bacterium]